MTEKRMFFSIHELMTVLSYLMTVLCFSHEILVLNMQKKSLFANEWLNTDCIRMQSFLISRFFVDSRAADS